MPDERDDGGQAFPSDRCEGCYGMTLRDYFAAQLLVVAKPRPEDVAGDFSVFAQMCYRVADAMLEARKQ
jgi:hypothetical protein